MIRVLLTGATGFLGSRLLERMTAVPGAYAVSVLKRSFSDIGRIAHLVDVIQIEDLDRGDCSRLFERRRYDVIVHCATNYGRKQVSRSDIIESNLMLPLRLLELGIKHGVSAFVNTDTFLDKNVSDYTLSKRQFREWLQSLSPGIKSVNMVLEHFYGPGDDASKFVTSIVRALVRRAPEIPLTLGEQRRDFIYIDDVIDALVKVMDRIAELPSGYRDFEVGSGKSVSIREMVELAKELASNQVTRLNFGAIPYRLNEPMDVSVNTASLVTLGWNSRWSLEQGLIETIRAEQQRP